MWNYLFKVNYWDSDAGEHGEEKVEFLMIQADTAVNAVEQLEDYYRDELCSFECNIFEYEPIHICEECYEKYKKGWN